ncbi:hypothetical protein CC86DRAFT_399985 [Ophiobolus disseminans]|uniref:Uncharacterized protein n=1 Tax=Ophiobolus disseminans TaxID=1469910 RepID=A0A6A7AKY3_9PLEO|nr:hypothetical protein CC86DRAFT_399985 [Ophiobolus disseminans]
MSSTSSSAKPTDDASGQPEPLVWRDEHGYRMDMNGFLNVTPMGAEKTITKKNAQDSPLLGLPPEIRNMIWKYVLGRQKIKLSATRYPDTYYLASPARGTALIWFDLLCVCRQIYAEAALLPRALNTPTFPNFSTFLKKVATGKLHHTQSVSLRTILKCLKTNKELEKLVPVSAFEPFKTVDISLYVGDETRGVQERVETALRARFVGKEVSIRFHDSYEWMMLEWGKSSPRNLTRAQPVNKNGNSARPKRGVHGFHKFKNGLLNLTPVSDDELALCDRNARDSELLHLPPDIGAMIWSYALGGQTIFLLPKPDPMAAVCDPKDRFPLLSVCRQIYSEAALLPRTLSTFAFWRPMDYLDYANSRLTKHARYIKLRVMFWNINQWHFSGPQSRDIRTLEILSFDWHYRPGSEHKMIRENEVKKIFAGKHLVLRYVDSDKEFNKAWRGEGEGEACTK